MSAWILATPFWSAYSEGTAMSQHCALPMEERSACQEHAIGGCRLGSRTPASEKHAWLLQGGFGRGVRDTWMRCLHRCCSPDGVPRLSNPSCVGGGVELDHLLGDLLLECLLIHLHSSCSSVSAHDAIKDLISQPSRADALSCKLISSQANAQATNAECKASVLFSTEVVHLPIICMRWAPHSPG